jgi:hypothetical protein
MLKPKATRKPLVITDATKKEVENFSGGVRAFTFWTKLGPSAWFYETENPLWFTTSYKSKLRSN